MTNKDSKGVTVDNRAFIWLGPLPDVNVTLLITRGKELARLAPPEDSDGALLVLDVAAADLLQGPTLRPPAHALLGL